jgi:hypothetical protein
MAGVFVHGVANRYTAQEIDRDPRMWASSRIVAGMLVPGPNNLAMAKPAVLMSHARRARPVRCTSAYRPIAVDWLQLKLK